MQKLVLGDREYFLWFDAFDSDKPNGVAKLFISIGLDLAKDSCLLGNISKNKFEVFTEHVKQIQPNFVIEVKKNEI